MRKLKPEAKKQIKTEIFNLLCEVIYRPKITALEISEVLSNLVFDLFQNGGDNFFEDK